MIVFNLNHEGGLLDMIHYRMIKCGDDEAILMVAVEMADKSLYERLLEKHIFSKILFYDYSQFIKDTTEESILKKLNTFFDDLDSTNNLSFNSVKMFYTCSDLSDPFAIYVATHNYKLTILEIAHGDFVKTNTDKYEGLVSVGLASRAFADLQKKYHVLCNENSEYTTVYYGYESKNVKKDEYEAYDYRDFFSMASPELKERLSYCFNFAPEEYESIKQLVLVNSVGFFIGMGIPADKIAEIYLLMCDLYLDYTLPTAIKYHPYSYRFDAQLPNTISIISSRYNVEMINYYDSIQIETIMSFSASTAISKMLERRYRRKVMIGDHFISIWERVKEIFCVLFYINSIEPKTVTLYQTFDNRLNSDIYQDYITDIIKSRKLNIQYRGFIDVKKDNIECKSYIIGLNYNTWNKRLASNADYIQIGNHKITELYSETLYKNKQFVQYMYHSHKNTNRLIGFYHFSNAPIIYPHVRSYQFGFSTDSIELHNIDKRKIIVYDNLLKDNKIESALTYLTTITTETPEVSGRLGRAYRDGIGVKKDVSKALKYMDLAVSTGCKWIIPECYKLHISSDSDECVKKGCELLKTALKNQESWAVNEYYDLLLKENTQESIAKAHRIIKTNINQRNPDSLGRLGRAYRDGIGVEQDTDKANELMDLAIENGCKWIISECHALHLKRGKKEDIEKANGLSEIM